MNWRGSQQGIVGWDSNDARCRHDRLCIVPSVLFALPVIALTGFAFASLAMIVHGACAQLRLFHIYQTLFLTPMLFLSGAVFPVTQLPDIFQQLSHLLPLHIQSELIRPEMLDRPGRKRRSAHQRALHIRGGCHFSYLWNCFRRRLMC